MKALCALLLLFVAAPSRGPQDGKDRPLWDLGVTDRNKQLFEAIQGAWTLTEFARPGYRPDDHETRGFLVATGGFLSIEIHGLQEERFGDRFYFQTGTHRFEFTLLGRLNLTSLIGTTNMPDTREIQFERPGLVREYVVSCTGETLELTRIDDGSTLTFRRLKADPGAHRDIFGRETEPAAEPATDPAKGEPR